LTYNFSLISYFKISDDSSQINRHHSSSSSSSSSSVSLSSLSSIDFSSINSDFTANADAGAIFNLTSAIGMALTAVSNTGEDAERLAEILIELLRVFTNGNGQSSSSSSNNELENKYSNVIMSNQFDSSKSKKNVTLGLFQLIKETTRKSLILKPI
jgi:hypothetical protein